MKTQAQYSASADQVLQKLGGGFLSDTVAVNGTKLHYVRGGSGPVIVLIHGFPMDWSVYHKIMPRLAAQFTVIAVDLRGIGGSSATSQGYDAPNMAKDINGLLSALKLDRPYVVGHDIGGMVAYAYARLYPEHTRGAMILDVPLPGIEPWEECTAGPGFWHIPFHQTPELPELLLADRQAVYFRYMLPASHFSEADVTRFAHAYAGPGRLRAGLEFYRAFPANGLFNNARRAVCTVPLVWAAGEKSFFSTIGPKLVKDLKAHGCTMVRNELIKGSSHWIMIEQPDSLSGLIRKYASQ